MKDVIRSMKYLNYDKNLGKFKVGVVDIPKPLENEILLKVLATCVNRVDILEKKGLYKAVQDNNIIGVEVVGIEVDPENMLPKNDLNQLVGAVVRGGGYAQYVKLNKNHLIPFDFPTKNFLNTKIPNENLPNLAEYASIPEAFLTAFQLLSLYGNPEPGAWVYIPAAAGGVGTAAIQLCKRIYNCKVIASCSSETKATLCKGLGADFVICYKGKELEEIQKEISQITNGKGVNCILDCIGPSNAEFHGQIIAQDGRWILYGLLGNNVKTTENIMQHVLMKRVKLIGSLLRNRDEQYKSDLTANFNKQVIPLFRNQTILPVVGNIFSLNWKNDEADSMDQAHTVMEKNETLGRVVVLFN